MTFTARDLHDQIVTATNASDGKYDVDAITEEIISKYGAVNVDTIDSTEFWQIVGKHSIPTFIAQVATAEELREAAKGPDRCPRHHGIAANPDALPCEEGAVYVASSPFDPERRDEFECSHEAANHVDLFGDTDLFGEQSKLIITKVEAS